MIFTSRKRGPEILIHVRVAGIIAGDARNEAFDEKVPEGLDLQGVFDELNRKKRIERHFFKKLPTLERTPTIMVNGDRVDLPEGLATKIKDNDELSIVAPIAGG